MDTNSNVIIPVTDTKCIALLNYKGKHTKLPWLLSDLQVLRHNKQPYAVQMTIAFPYVAILKEHPIQGTSEAYMIA